MSAAFTEDVIAEAVLSTYDKLSTKFKPVKATEEFFQWVPLSGIVAVTGNATWDTNLP